MIGNLRNKLKALSLRSVVDATLEDTASVTVSSDFNTVRGDGVVDKLVILRGKLVQAFLNDMIAVEVLEENHDVQAKGKDDRVDLERGVSL